jgi:hypothetical protein
MEVFMDTIKRVLLTATLFGQPLIALSYDDRDAVLLRQGKLAVLLRQGELIAEVYALKNQAFDSERDALNCVGGALASWLFTAFGAYAVGETIEFADHYETLKRFLDRLPFTDANIAEKTSLVRMWGLYNAPFWITSCFTIGAATCFIYCVYRAMHGAYKQDSISIDLAVKEAALDELKRFYRFL